MRHALVAGWLLLCPVAPALAEVNFSIGINLGGYPSLQPIPGYPVYYAPGVDANYFFYDGLYWVYDGDSWYASSWYNGPWRVVDPFAVPVYLLRVPVRYYRHPPAYFRSWRADAPPRWHEHWGRDWEERRRGWDRWDRRRAPPPAPLPTYQREYRGERYPDPARQAEMHNRYYGYRPNDTQAREQWERQQHERSPAVQEPRREQMERRMNPQERLNRERERQGGGG